MTSFLVCVGVRAINCLFAVCKYVCDWGTGHKPFIFILKLLLQLRNPLNQLLVAPSTIIRVFPHRRRSNKSFSRPEGFRRLLRSSPARATRDMKESFRWLANFSPLTQMCCWRKYLHAHLLKVLTHQFCCVFWFPLEISPYLTWLLKDKKLASFDELLEGFWLKKLMS